LLSCYRDDLTIGITCTNLLSSYLDYPLHSLFAFAATMNEDYHQCIQHSNVVLIDKIKNLKKMLTAILYQFY